MKESPIIDPVEPQAAGLVQDDLPGATRAAPGDSCIKKPCDRGQGVAEAAPQAPFLPAHVAEATSVPLPEPLSHNVRLAGKMTDEGYQPENWQWFAALTCTDREGHRVGRDPITIAPETLISAGHGPRRTRSIIRALGDEPTDPNIVRHKHLRKHCLSCAATPGKIHRCAIIDCPLWPYRMGRNPHHPRRGSNPFA
jgi:hypothetical protein